MTGPRDLARTTGRGRIPTPLRDRRPALAALALLLIVAGALGSALVVYRTGHRVDVLVARQDIAPGHKMTTSDFTTTRVTSDTGGLVIPQASEPNFIGTYAAARIPAGTLVNSNMFKSQDVMPDGAAIVGVTLAVNQRPAQALQANDVVEVVYVAKSNEGGSATSQPGSNVLVTAARVAYVDSGSANSVSGSGDTSVSLLIQTSAVGTVVPAAANDEIALVLLPPGTKPTVDFDS